MGTKVRSQGDRRVHSRQGACRSPGASALTAASKGVPRTHKVLAHRSPKGQCHWPPRGRHGRAEAGWERGDTWMPGRSQATLATKGRRPRTVRTRRRPVRGKEELGSPFGLPGGDRKRPQSSLDPSLLPLRNVAAAWGQRLGDSGGTAQPNLEAFPPEEGQPICSFLQRVPRPMAP